MRCTSLGRNHAVLHGWGSQATLAVELDVAFSGLFLLEFCFLVSIFSSGFFHQTTANTIGLMIERVGQYFASKVKWEEARGWGGD